MAPGNRRCAWEDRMICIWFCTEESPRVPRRAEAQNSGELAQRWSTCRCAETVFLWFPLGRSRLEPILGSEAVRRKAVRKPSFHVEKNDELQVEVQNLWMKVFGNYFAFRNPGKFLSLPPQSLKLKECFGQSLELSVQKTLRPKVFLVETLRIGGRPRSGRDFSQVCIWQFCISRWQGPKRYGKDVQGPLRILIAWRVGYFLQLTQFLGKAWKIQTKRPLQGLLFGQCHLRSFSAHVRKSRAEIQPPRHLDAVGKVVMQSCRLNL